MSSKNFPQLDSFLRYLSYERSLKITSSIKSRFSAICDYYSDHEYTREGVRAFLEYIQKIKKLKNSTLNKYIQALKLVDLYFNTDVMRGFVSYKTTERDRKPLGDLISDHEMKLISELNLKHERIERETNVKYRCALTLLRFTGMPPVDLCNLKWEMDKNTHFEYFRQKTGKHMLVPIVKQVRTLLDRLARNNEYIFGSRQGRMKEATLRHEIVKRVQALGIKKHVTPYSFRYSMITWCYINGGEGMIPKIAKISGHTVSTAMKYYAQFDAQVLIDALYATHPGLISKAPIDIIKRTIADVVATLVDKTKYEVDVTITPKQKTIRHLHFS